MSAAIYSRMRIVAIGVALSGLIAGFLGVVASRVSAQAPPGGRPTGVISGTVTSSKGAEAGVWVIAETNDLPTKFIKIVVTDDAGKFVLPELPKAGYSVWVRGYGLVDSVHVNAAPGATLALTAVLAKTPQDAAQYYPPNYWLSLLQIPPKSAFPGTGTGPGGNGISPNVKHQAQFINAVMHNCQAHHQLGQKITRDISHMRNFDSTQAAWDYRLKTGQRGDGMNNQANQLGRPAVTKMFADWTDRIAAGEVPPAPPRPKGVERNLVLTMWDWSEPTSFPHDITASFKHNPRVNAGGPVYLVSAGHGRIWVGDIANNSSRDIIIPTREDPDSIPSRHPQEILEPSAWYGMELHWGNTPDKKADPHNPIMDSKTRIWMTSRIRGPEAAAWCKDGSKNKYAAYYPLPDGTGGVQARQASYYDPRSGKFALVDTCFGTHHLEFGHDADETLWLSGHSGAVGWINTRIYDQTGDEQAAQGWCPTVLDTNGDGKITKPWNEPGNARIDPAKIDPTKDTHVGFGVMYYGVNPDPTDKDGSVVWLSKGGPFPGAFYRFDRGANPPETCITEMFEPPAVEVNPKVDPAKSVHSPRGGPDLSMDGMVWAGLAGSGNFVRFDRSKCKVLNGPTALGQHCVEGWTAYPNPGPQLKGVTGQGSADFIYFNWTDRYGTLGLGPDLPMIVGTGSDSLQVHMPKTGERIILRVPYPLGFYSRGMSGRIDDPNAGWKGRGVFAAFSTQMLWQLEGGKGTRSKLVHFQMRPNPLAQ
ncbi:MAG: hypothetical protein A3K13_11040 [Gemmatimonadetes bacterium RIFCSPLOWO2_12_FULL_68_9]|nr:MAG: hypothetical protein A3K13_11040 [Gemmatimonadetes bacterium RIFCSPLOWO2_12_FULL_68_9]